MMWPPTSSRPWWWSRYRRSSSWGTPRSWRRRRRPAARPGGECRRGRRHRRGGAGGTTRSVSWDGLLLSTVRRPDTRGRSVRGVPETTRDAVTVKATFRHSDVPAAGESMPYVVDTIELEPPGVALFLEVVGHLGLPVMT